MDSPDLASEDESTLDYVYDILWMEIGTFVRNKVAVKFWSCMNSSQPIVNFCRDGESSEDIILQYKLFTNFVNAVKSLDAYYQFIKTSLERLDAIRKLDNIKSLKKLNELLRAALLSQLPTHFNNVVFSFYSVSFKVFFNLHQSTSGSQGKFIMQIFISF